jgi:hypothetical protein
LNYASAKWHTRSYGQKQQNGLSQIEKQQNDDSVKKGGSEQVYIQQQGALLYFNSVPSQYCQSSPLDPVAVVRG